MQFIRLNRLFSALETSMVLRIGLRVMLLEDGSMLGKKTLLLGLDDLALTHLLLSLEFLLFEFSITLSLIDDEFLLPQTLDLAFVLKLTHAALLSIHLLQTLVLCEFLH